MTNQTNVTMTLVEARREARKLYVTGKINEAMDVIQAIITGVPSTNLVNELELVKAPLTASEKAALFGNEVVSEGKAMVKEVAQDAPLMAKDLFGFAGKVVGGTLNLVGRTAGTLAGQVKKGWDEAQK